MGDVVARATAAGLRPPEPGVPARTSSANRTRARTSVRTGRSRLLRRRRLAEVEHHDGEEEKDHDGPGVDQDLDGRREGRVEKAEDAAQAGEGQDEEERVVGLVPGDDHGRDRADAQDGQDR